MAHAETNVLRGWLLKHPTFAVLFRQQVGLLWAGKAVKQWETVEDGRVVKWATIREAERVNIGVKGLPDYGGWRKIIVTQEMVGQPVAVYCGVEGKTEDGVVSAEQKLMLHGIRKAGGIAFVVRNEDTLPSDWEPQQ